MVTVLGERELKAAHIVRKPRGHMWKFSPR